MPNIAGVLKSEIARVARKVIKSELATTKKATVQYRREIAQLKRQIATVERALKAEARQAKKAGASAAAAEEVVQPAKGKKGRKGKAKGVKVPAKKGADGRKGPRFSAKGVKTHRGKLGLSAADYGRLVGVSGLTIYNWEAEKSRPRDAQLVSLVGIRGLGKREALKRLEGASEAAE